VHPVLRASTPFPSFPKLVPYGPHSHIVLLLGRSGLDIDSKTILDGVPSFRANSPSHNPPPPFLLRFERSVRRRETVPLLI